MPVSFSAAAFAANSFPNVYVNKVTLTPTSLVEDDNRVQVKVDYSLKKIKNNDTLDPWFVDDGLKGVLRVAIFILTDPNQTRKLLSSREYLREHIVATRPPRGMFRAYVPFENSSVLPFKHAVKRKATGLNEEGFNITNLQALGSNALPVEGLNYSYTFTLADDQSLNYLSCVLVPYQADLDECHTNSGLNKLNRSFPVGSPLVENIFSSRAPYPTSFIFKLKSGDSKVGPRGSIWAGHVHRHGGQFLGGAHHGGKKIPLEPIIVANKKIIDHRIIKQFWQEENKQLYNSENFSLGNMVNSLVWRKLIQDFVWDYKGSYYTPMWTSRKSDNSVNLVFGCNVGAIIRHNTRFSYLYKNTAELLNAVDMGDISLYRRRVHHETLGNKLTMCPTPSLPIESCEIDHLVGTLGDGALSSLGININSDVKHFIAHDGDMASINDGVYQYFIKMEFFDNSSTKLISIINSLKLEVEKYNKFVAEAEVPGRYDYYTRSFTPNAIKKLYLVSNAWKELVNSYIAAVTTILGAQAFMKYRAAAWYRSFLIMTDPYSATLDTMVEFGNFVETFLGKLQKIVDTAPVTGMSPTPAIPGSTIESIAVGRPLITVDHNFMESYNARGKQGLGFVYVPDHGAMGHGLASFTADTWRSRIRAESVRYEMPLLPPAELPSRIDIDPNAFLSVIGIRTPQHMHKQQVAYLPVTLDMKLDDLLPLLHSKLGPMSQYNLGYGGPTTNSGLLRSSIMSFEGVTVAALKRSVGEYIYGVGKPSLCEDDMVDAGFVLGDDSRFVLPSAVSAATSENSSLDIVGGVNPDENVYYGELATRLLSEIVEGYKAKSLSRSELIKGSYAYQKLSQLNFDIEDITSYNFNLNYNALKRVECLIGYRVGTDEHVISSSPIWAPLNSSLIRAAGASDQGLLCRLRSLSSILDRENMYDLPAYDQYFTLGRIPRADSLETMGASTSYPTAQKKLSDLRGSPGVNKKIESVPVEYLASMEVMHNLGSAADSVRARVDNKGGSGPSPSATGRSGLAKQSATKTRRRTRKRAGKKSGGSY